MGMTNEQALFELKEALESPEAQVDPRGVVLHWLHLIGEDASSERQYRLSREGVAMSLVETHGYVTSGTLADKCLITPEGARLVLRKMVARGELQSEGQKRGRRYVGRNPTDGSV
jgi:predicted HTH transcriptional regulator